LFVAAYCGILAGDLLSYYLGRKYGRAILTRKIFRWIPIDRLSALDGRGAFFLFVGGRLMSGVFLLAGIAGMPFPKVIAIDAV
jgi:membrane protein DedA with SNARE-associated domain